jgi:hypothetical protein
MPNTRSVGDQAFLGCFSLSHIVLGDGVTKIGERAFYGCSSLTSMDMGSMGALTEIGAYAFERSGLETVILPSGSVPVLTIGDNAFAYTGIKEVAVTRAVSEIGRLAFSNCHFLERFISEEGGAFEADSNGILYRVSGFKVLVACPERMSPVDGVITIGSDVADVLPGALSYIDAISSIEVEEGNIQLFSEDGILYKNDSGKRHLVACPSGKHILEADISADVVRSQAFAGVSSLKKVVIGAGVGCVEESAFSNDANLTDVVVESGTTFLGRYAFFECGSFRYVSLPKLTASDYSKLGDDTVLFALYEDDGTYRGDSISNMLSEDGGPVRLSALRASGHVFYGNGEALYPTDADGLRKVTWSVHDQSVTLVQKIGEVASYGENPQSIIADGDE